MDCEKYILYVDVSLLLSDFSHFSLGYRLSIPFDFCIQDDFFQILLQILFDRVCPMVFFYLLP